MKIVTSIGHSRIERQQKCIASWLAVGCEVTAVQSAGEADVLIKDFPQVRFVETSLVGDLFGKPKFVRLSAMLNEAPCLILNSDIEVRSTPEAFAERWSPAGDKKIKLGIRWDEDPETKQMSMLKWGIDAFLITPEIVADLPDIGMTMGMPAWDYWIPIHLSKRRYEIITNKEPELIHEDHKRNWSDRDYEIGVSIIQNKYRMNRTQAALQIQRLTGRSKVPVTRRRIR